MQMSDPVQKVLLAVGSGLALILSIIALVVALNAGGGHGGNHGEGRMFGGAQQMQFDGQGGPRGQGGPGQRGQGGPGVGGPGQRQGMIPPGGVQITPNGTGTTTTK